MGLRSRKDQWSGPTGKRRLDSLGRRCAGDAEPHARHAQLFRLRLQLTNRILGRRSRQLLRTSTIELLITIWHPIILERFHRGRLEREREQRLRERRTRQRLRSMVPMPEHTRVRVRLRVVARRRRRLCRQDLSLPLRRGTTDPTTHRRLGHRLSILASSRAACWCRRRWLMLRTAFLR